MIQFSCLYTCLTTAFLDLRTDAALLENNCSHVGHLARCPAALTRSNIKDYPQSGTAEESGD